MPRDYLGTVKLRNSIEFINPRPISMSLFIRFMLYFLYITGFSIRKYLADYRTREVT